MEKQKFDFAFIGGGIMSATLATWIHQLMPNASIAVFERLDAVAKESSDAWNNAGTGHSAFCELNYTSLKADGTIDCSKALKIAEQFEISKEFWTFLVKNKIIDNASSFINRVAHYSFVQNKEDILFLKKRFDTLKSNLLFEGMEFTTDLSLLKNWFPLLMEGRNEKSEVAATKMKIGTDVNYGKLTELLFQYLEKQNHLNIYLQHEVNDIARKEEGVWELEITDLSTNKDIEVDASFVFVGAGGGALKLLNKAEIPEVDGFGGFPVGGKWLKCTNEEIIQKHHAKVYGKAEIGAPPMSVPHLDTRIINGKKELLFGPFAGFSTKFLKQGSYFDLPRSIDLDNLLPMIEVGVDNIPLTKYLIEQVQMTFHEKIEALKKYYPNANASDWELVEAGQRVQVIKKDEHNEGVLEFGTELIITKDGTLAGLLGASPGASTAVYIMLEVLKKCFPDKYNSIEWQNKFKEIIPSFGKKLNEDEILLAQVRNSSFEILGV